MPTWLIIERLGDRPTEYRGDMLGNRSLCKSKWDEAPIRGNFNSPLEDQVYGAGVAYDLPGATVHVR